LVYVGESAGYGCPVTVVVVLAARVRTYLKLEQRKGKSGDERKRGSRVTGVVEKDASVTLDGPAEGNRGQNSCSREREAAARLTRHLSVRVLAVKS
jgi:hypothetical protein